MAENENNEVEVEVHEPSTDSMLDNMVAGKASEVQDNFNSLMHNRATEALDDRKVELAKDIFRQSIEGTDGSDYEEFDKMGLVPNEQIIGDKLEDNLVDIDMQTGLPTDKEETNENT